MLDICDLDSIHMNGWETYLKHVLSMEKLVEHLHSGIITARRYPFLPLRILNYSHKAMECNYWGDGTIDYCRGLITGIATRGSFESRAEM